LTCSHSSNCLSVQSSVPVHVTFTSTPGGIAPG
jgi:hypothetical protein